MRFGMCMGVESPEYIKLIKESGYDYVECGFGGLSRADDAVFESFKAALIENGMKCEAANSFFPGDYPIINHNYKCKEYCDFIEKGMARGKEIGMKFVVFGSGNARKVPEGTSYAEGFRQLGDFLGSVVAPIAEKYGINVVVEPLRKDESNIINTVKEGTALAVLSGKDNIACLADLYHMVKDGNEDIRQLKGSIRHAHISNPAERDGITRGFPKSLDEYDYKGFIDALEYAGCERCSVEARCTDYPVDVAETGKLLSQLKQS